MVATYPLTYQKEAIRWVRTTRKNPCQICNKFGYCEISDNRQVAHCMHVATGGRASLSRLGGWYHNLTPNFGISNGTNFTAADLRVKTVEVETKPEIKPLSKETVSQVFHGFFGYLGLDDKHRNYLQNAGAAERWANCCRSLKQKEASKLAQRLVDRFGSGICERHPLLMQVKSKDGKRAWWTIAGAADGILFPAFNLEGQILGVQLRKDDPKGSNDRYIWLSHSNLGGTPLTVFKALPGAQNSHMLVITEGFKKGSAAAEAWGCHAISLAGVSAYKEMELIRQIEALEVKVIALAFDQDKRQKQQVERAETRLKNLLAAMLPDTSIYILNWNMEQGKGFDDAWLAGAEFKFDQATNEGPRYCTDLPGEAHARAFGGFKPYYSLTEARTKHRQFFANLLSKPDGSKYALTSPTGTGKSQAADDELAEALTYNRLTGRFLLLAPNKPNILERTGPNTALGKAVLAGKAVIQLGRNLVDLNDRAQARTPFDCANPQANDAGAARQVAARVVCTDCPFGSAENWEKHFPGQPRTFKCEVDGYIASRKRSEKARLVIATKESFLNNSEQLGEFDGVICDEELPAYLIERFEVNSQVLAGWRDKINLKNINAPEWLNLLKILETGFDNMAVAYKDDKGPARLIDCQETFEAAGHSLGLDYNQVIWECGFYWGQDNEGNHNFETPYTHNAKLVLPFKAAQDLLDRLRDPENPAWLTRKSDGSFGLMLHVPRAKLIRILNGKTLIVLDATVSPVLKRLVSGIKEVCYNVKQNLHITQTTSGLYSKTDLYNPETRERIAAANKAFAAGSNKHLTIMPLRFESGPDALETPAGSETEHWGLHRATSKYTGFDSLTLVGHHIRPIDQIKAEMLAARAFAGHSAPNISQSEQKLRLYNHLLPNGRAAGRWMKQDADPDVQEAIEAEYTANIVQAIGRLRAALRPAHLEPARVLILCNEPVSDLKIDSLVTTGELITYPPEKQLFINNSYMKFDEKGGLVPSYTSVMENRDVWDAGLIQDETPESQDYDYGGWPFEDDPWQRE